MIWVLGKLVWKEHLSILETCWLTEYCVKTTWIVLMVWSQQTDVVLIVFRVLKMWIEFGQKDFSNWKKLTLKVKDTEVCEYTENNVIECTKNKQKKGKWLQSIYFSYI